MQTYKQTLLQKLNFRVQGVSKHSYLQNECEDVYKEIVNCPQRVDFKVPRLDY